MNPPGLFGFKDGRFRSVRQKGYRPTTDMREFERRARIAAWVATRVMPHEAAVRARLARFCRAGEEIDELIQDAYCRLAMLEAVDHIDRPDAYFFSIARNLLIRRLKRAQVVPIETVAEIDAISVDEAPSPERQVGARLDYDRVRAIIAALPERCRRIVEMRRIEGLPQKEIARRLGVTEKVVEKQVWQGIRAVQARLRTEESDAEARMDAAEWRLGS